MLNIDNVKNLVIESSKNVSTSILLNIDRNI
jgi:hypothetical protein